MTTYVCLCVWKRLRAGIVTWKFYRVESAHGVPAWGIPGHPRNQVQKYFIVTSSPSQIGTRHVVPTETLDPREVYRGDRLSSGEHVRFLTLYVNFHFFFVLYI